MIVQVTRCLERIRSAVDEECEDTEVCEVDPKVKTLAESQLRVIAVVGVVDKRSSRLEAVGHTFVDPSSTVLWEKGFVPHCPKPLRPSKRRRACTAEGMKMHPR